MESIALALSSITSAPALAAALRRPDRGRAALSTREFLRRNPLTPMYHIYGVSVEEEALSAAHSVLEIAERMRRLAGAYGEWTCFDAGAYFDLTSAQVEYTVKVSERVSTVHVVFFVDRLLPSFQMAEAFWFERFFLAYAAIYEQPFRSKTDVPLEEHFYLHSQPAMAEHWRRLVAVVAWARTRLSEEIGFLAVNGGEDERARWRHAWDRPPALGLSAALSPALNTIPTLTLAFDFPLPANLQPGRLRRLRHNRDRQHRRQLVRSERERD